MSSERFVTDYLLIVTHREAYHLAATRTFDDACMVSAEASIDLFDANLMDAPMERIEALAEVVRRNYSYYFRARDFLNACEGEPAYVIKF